MKKNKYHLTIKNCSAATGIGMGIGGAVILSVLLSIGLSSLIMNGTVPEIVTSRYIFFIRALSALAGVLLGTSMVKGKMLPITGFITMGYLIILLGLGIVVYGSSFENFGSGIASVLAGGGIACIFKLMSQRKKKRIVRHIK